ncbi:Wzz/FepE/Etk N-terminal domain-containing protein [Ruegeria arenilitoris]|uniref:Wzz/FepE/Etk N-terminal domain-containing protein n=1 Tax=Ruegeria arenilitoris TaxID=1173585 RepID=UPI0014810188
MSHDQPPKPPEKLSFNIDDSVSADTRASRHGSIMQPIRRNFLAIIIVSLLGGLGAGLLNSAQEPKYTASSLLLIKPYSLSILGYEPVSTDLTSSAVVLETQAQLLRSPANIARVAEALLSSDAFDQNMEGVVKVEGGDPAADVALYIEERLKVQQVADSEILRISFTSTNAALSAIVANAVATEFLDQQRAEKISEIAQVRERLQEQLAEVTEDAEQSQRQVRERSESLASPPSELRANLAEAEAAFRAVLSRLPERDATDVSPERVEELRSLILDAASNLSSAIEQVDRWDGGGGDAASDPELETLMRDAEAAGAVHSEILRRLREIRQLQAVATADAQVVSEATPPTRPSNLAPEVVGLMVGFSLLLLMMLLAIIVDTLGRPRSTHGGKGRSTDAG